MNSYPNGFVTSTEDRRQRVRWLREAAACLLDGRPVPRDAALYLGGAVSAWLARGGRLDRDFLRVAAPRGSHSTPQAIFWGPDPEPADDDPSAHTR